MSNKEQGVTASKVHIPSLESVSESYLAALSRVFTFSLSSSGKGLNFITAIPLHPACLSKFPLVAINIYFMSLSSIGENSGWNK